MPGKPDLDARFAELATPPNFETTRYRSHVTSNEPAVFQWLSEVANLVGLATGHRGVHWNQVQAAVAASTEERGLPVRSVDLAQAALAATKADRERGLLADPEFAVAALTFDDFLDHAEELHKGKQIEGSAVLVAAVLEDTLKKIAGKNGITPAATIEPAVNDLVNGVRTAASHARWEQLDLKSVGEAIAGTRGLIADYLEEP